jgi:hypothetical protein
LGRILALFRAISTDKTYLSRDIHKTYLNREDVMVRKITPPTSLIVSLAILALFAPAAHAQEWASKMFEETSHDFGVVARSSKTEFEFNFKNLYRDDIHVSAVRTSCGCTTPIINTPIVKSLENGVILARFNTRTFSGQRSATITVTIDKPQRAEVRLTVKGTIRQDVVLDPPAVIFGDIDEPGAQQKIKISYAGRSNWMITEVVAKDGLSTELKEVSRQGGRVDYELSVTVNDTSNAGYLTDQLTLRTNDQLSNINLAVEGRILSPLMINPSTISIGLLNPGQTITKKVVVQGKEPFRILDVKCDTEGFVFEPSEKQALLHIVPLSFTADKTGMLKAEIEIVTDLKGGSIGKCSVSATVADTTARVEK